MKGGRRKGSTGTEAQVCSVFREETRDHELDEKAERVLFRPVHHAGGGNREPLPM